MLKANKLHHKGIIYHQKMCNRILIVLFSRSTCRHEILHNKNLSCQNNTGKAGKLRNLSIFNKEGNEIHASLPQLSKNADHRHEVKLPIRILHLSAEAQVFRKSRHLSLLCYFYCFNVLAP